MEWHYSENDQQKGPISEEELKAKLADGSLPPQTLVWREGMATWTEASQIAELGSGATAAATSLPAATNQPSGGQYGAPQPGAVPGPQGGPMMNGPMVPNYLWQSICVLVLCCMPLGIVAVIQATKVDSSLRMGDIEAAKAASDSAKMWCWIALGVGIVVNVLGFVLVLLSSFAGV